MPSMLTALGLMSGTSLDGIDAAIIRTDGERVELTEHCLGVPYTDELRAKMRSCFGGKNKDAIPDIEREMTVAHADAVKELIKRSGFSPRQIDVIGFHGQTIQHRPEEGTTWQIGDGALLAQLTGINVVNDFRSADMRAGGQGAPLVPLFHAALMSEVEKPVAVLNIGGVANVTYVGKAEKNSEPYILAFDTGPGGALLDDWMLQHTGKRFDEGGRTAQSGRINGEILEALLEDPFFNQQPPKSLDRDRFKQNFMRHIEGESNIGRLSVEDGAATLAAFTARAVYHGCKYFPEKPKRWYVTGGSRFNQVIMAKLKEYLPGEVDAIEVLALNGDALEAQAFAFLAVRSLNKMPLSLPTTTGVSRAVTGGAFYQALHADAV
jgi:anhydro-N-acetylmuramic acid kinase